MSTVSARILRADRFCAVERPLSALTFLAGVLSARVLNSDREAFYRALERVNSAHAPASREWFNSMVRYLSRVVTDEDWDGAVECIGKAFAPAGKEARV